MPSSVDSPEPSTQPTAFQRSPLLLVSALLPLLAYAVAWSSFSSLLTWRHSQLFAGAVGGLVLLLLRALPLNPSSKASGKTPLSVAMVALVGTVALALPLAHPELWSAASVALMASGVTVWLWYPPHSFAPFRAAAQAAVALSIAILVPVVLEGAGISPWHGPGHGIFGDTPLSGSFDHSNTLTAALLFSAFALVVAAWPNPRVPRRTQLSAIGLLAALCVLALLVARPLPLPATIAFALAAGLGHFWRASTSESDPFVQHQAPRYRQGAFVAVIGMLIAFTTPPLLHAVPDELFPPEASYASSLELDPSWQTADPLPKAVHSELQRAEWRALRHNLPFGAGVGTWLDETLLYMEPVRGVAPDGEPTRQAGWPDQPRSLLAASVTEHGILAGFVWLLVAIGGLLLARLVIRNSAFPTSLASLIGVAPGVGLAFIPGTSQMAPMLALILSWFLLCAPLARAEERAALRLVPAASTHGDPRKPPRGRIFILLIPGLVVAWFSLSHVRWSALAERGYRANDRGELQVAQQYFEAANRWLPHPSTLFNEARLLEMVGSPDAHALIEARYVEALRRRPKAPSYLVARAQWRLRLHQQGVEETHLASGAPARERAWLEAALADLDLALEEAPRWALAQQLRLECLILLERYDEASAAYEHAYAGLISPENRNELRILRIRELAWKHNDREAAKALLDVAEQKPAHPITRYLMQHERGRLVFWENTEESPYSVHTFHEGHQH